MAKIVENDKGFKVISLTIKDAKKLGFGIEGSGGCICARCGELCSTSDAKYVAVLNDTFCNTCYERWLRTATRYSDDAPFEERNFNYCKRLLKL